MPNEPGNLSSTVLILDDRPCDELKPLVRAVEQARGLQSRVIGKLHDALEMILHMQSNMPRGMIISWRLEGDNELIYGNLERIGEVLSTIFPGQWDDLAFRMFGDDTFRCKGHEWQDPYRCGWVLFLKILAGYMMTHGWFKKPRNDKSCKLSIVANSDLSLINIAIQAAIPGHPDIQAFSVPDEDPARSRNHDSRAKRDDAELIEIALIDCDDG